MNLSELLEQVLQMKGVTSAAVVSSEGLMVEAVSQEDMDLEFVSGLIASGMASSRVLASLMGEEDVTQTMIEYEQGPVLLTPIQPAEGGAEEYVAVVTLDSAQNLGRTRFQLRKLLPKIAAALEG